MGVTGLWSIVHPCARPIKLETLNRKRLAVDASIWIYQFLKAVRDKEGNALRNSHVVGFFRRICKLLFFGIKPVFVFDGGAPALKRQTISARKSRREGRRDDAVRTAGKLLAVQMQRRAEEEEQKRRDDRQYGVPEEETVPEEALVYADENLMSQQERQQNRKFRKKDAYHLPDLDVSMNEMGGPNDPRVMSLEELQAYARQFESGEDINVYDFSKIDYDSPFFTSLPASDRYNILNAARLRSRLRMGLSKDQLDSMFPNRMDFSRFQIERTMERNDLTQRLMHINEGGDTLYNGGGRVAGEKGREYVLVKNDGVEGGWALGVISDEGTKQETAIDLDKPATVLKKDDEWEDDDDFVDIPIEGLNRLPKRPKLDADADDSFAKQRQAFYKARKSGGRRKPKRPPIHNPLFVAEDAAEDDEEQWEEVSANGELFGEANGMGEEVEEEELQRAIAMSLGKDDAPSSQPDATQQGSEAEDDDMLEVFQQAAAPEARPIPKGSGRAIANMVNKRAYNVAPESNEVTSFGVPVPKPEESFEVNDQDDDSMDLQAALAESRRKKRKIPSPTKSQQPAIKPTEPAEDGTAQAGFTGPLPFEKLDLGTSLLGKKKMQERTEEAAGGFENPELVLKEQKKAGPLPPWFSGSLEDDIEKQKELDREDRRRAKEFNKQFQFQSKDEPRLRRKETNEVIDLEAEDSQKGFQNGEVIDLEAAEINTTRPADGTVLFDPKIRMGDLAEKVRVEPPEGLEKDHRRATPPKPSAPLPFQVDYDDEEEDDDHDHDMIDDMIQQSTTNPENQDSTYADQTAEDANELLDWSESEVGEDQTSEALPLNALKSTAAAAASKSPSPDFEDVDIPDKPASTLTSTNNGVPEIDDAEGPAPASSLVHQESLPDDVEQMEFDDFSDPEDEEILRSLTLEAEEHARFASTLNNKSQAQNIADYETELKQLRNQQKKDRRDADEVTHTMITECQQLLGLFGLPYVTAPMEAEAQCAELVRLGLVDGIVTDDSDCFLFGGTRIYKNMFNQAKFVECYLTSDLEKEFDLTREKLIQVAHLLGSDYTEGLPGVGPVTAVEIMQEFPTLEEFRNWWNGVQMNTVPKSEDAGNAFRKKFRKNATRLFLPPTFPDTRVSIAYNTPDVDSDPEAFQWGVPDLDALRRYLMATIGWSQERTDEVLVPVIRDMNRRIDEGTQSNINAFFEGGVGIGAAGATKASARGEAFAPRKRVGEGSKRMGTALSRMAEKAKLNRNITLQTVDDDRPEENNASAETTISGGNPRKQTTKKAKPTASRGKRASPTSSAEVDSDFEKPRKKAKKDSGSGKAAGSRRKNAAAM